MFSKNLKFLREKKNMEQLELAEMLGRKSSSSISEWEKGKYTPRIGTLNDIAKIFKVDIDDLMTKDLSKNNNSAVPSIETIYNQLEKPRQTKVYNFAEEQLEEQQKEKVLEFPNKEKIPTVHNSASAANPTELAYGDTVVEEEEFERVPNNADFAVPIIGDSMEPVIRNGQFVFVKEQPDVEDGEIAIVELDGDGVTCKEIYKDYENQTIILRSINDLYEDRIVSPEQIRIIGKVVF
ncbi:XRE family transcriptional regulator [Enterococcus avium]|uniref:XRE family transcriptional regulator n=1 Tax=Enterococcus avium TaxID=33945 RepID=UPI0032E3E06E